MSELVPIFVVWIVFYYTYKLIGLYARRKERLLMIEKMNAVGDVGIDDKELFAHSFTALRVGCLLIGVGIGLLIEVIIKSNAEVRRSLVWRRFRLTPSPMIPRFSVFVGPMRSGVSSRMESSVKDASICSRGNSTRYPATQGKVISRASRSGRIALT